MSGECIKGCHSRTPIQFEIIIFVGSYCCAQPKFLIKEVFVCQQKSPRFTIYNVLARFFFSRVNKIIAIGYNKIAAVIETTCKLQTIFSKKCRKQKITQ